ncbi:deoxyribose-phosphate aldolase [Aureimonas populi]|uniref:Deoxyribose-phosphate aldolase n=1 Tax=Aureimonas populi TaxID=1701758 RepID=A0ABW5CMM8_9HYPH|nr:deoxyribose-phosphate aldolase [Aureimonas populi]
MTEKDPVSEARELIACLDLTNLDEDCSQGDVDALIERAATPHGTVAAICIWPRFVAYARPKLPQGVKLATVVNFPAGGEDIQSVIAETRAALADGADEIDYVIAYGRIENDPGYAADHVKKVKEAAGGATLKAILETGELRDPGLVEVAAVAALHGGADFLKTSTGKTPVSATLPAARILLRSILQDESGRRLGFKPSGGIRSFEEARAYRDLAEEVMGEGWATPSTFRLGASGVLADLLAVAGGERRPEDKSDY